MSIGLIIVNADFLCKFSSNLACFVLLDGPICFSLDQLDPFGVYNSCSLWYIGVIYLLGILLFLLLLPSPIRGLVVMSELASRLDGLRQRLLLRS